MIQPRASNVKGKVASALFSYGRNKMNKGLDSAVNPATPKRANRDTAKWHNGLNSGNKRQDDPRQEKNLCELY